MSIFFSTTSSPSDPEKPDAVKFQPDASARTTKPRMHDLRQPGTMCTGQAVPDVPQSCVLGQAFAVSLLATKI